MWLCALSRERSADPTLHRYSWHSGASARAVLPGVVSACTLCRHSRASSSRSVPCSAVCKTPRTGVAFWECFH